MPQVTLHFPAVYPIVGMYRLAHDELLWRPMWNACYARVTQAGATTILWSFVSLPGQRLVSGLILGHMGRACGAKWMYELIEAGGRQAGIPMLSFGSMTTLLLVLNQVNIVFDMFLGKQMRAFRDTAYRKTVESRGKSSDFWTPYTEEYERPPNPQDDVKKLTIKKRLSDMVLRKVSLLLFGSIPIFGVILSAAYGALGFAREMHQPFFEVKHMQDEQITLWITERRIDYMLFGFFALLLERIPFFGLIFSVSNQIGAAMWAHDLEKRQHRFQRGELQPIPAEQGPADSASAPTGYMPASPEPVRRRVPPPP